MAATETVTSKPSSSDILIGAGTFIPTSKIVTSTSVKDYGYLIDAKTVSDEFVKIYGKIPTATTAVVNNMIRSTRCASGAVTTVYDCAPAQGSGLWWVSLSCEMAGIGDASKSVYSFILVDDAVATECRGTMVGGGGACCSFLVDARTATRKITLRAYHNYGSTQNVRSHISILNIVPNS